MKPRLLSEIMDRHAGKPIVVMGGAPSLPMDVEQVKHASAWISANEHGARLRGADYIVSVDRRHQRLRQNVVDVMRPFGVPLISQRFIGDYRIPEWDRWAYKGNSGLQAILVAWLLGGHPIITCGFGLYEGGVYWHEPQAKSSGTRKKPRYFEDLLAGLKRIVGDVVVRPVSGPLLAWWSQGYRAGEHYPEYREAPVVAEIRAASAAKYRWRRASPEVGMTRFAAGQECWLTEWEAAPHLKGGALQVVLKPAHAQV